MQTKLELLTVVLVSDFENDYIGVHQPAPPHYILCCCCKLLKCRCFLPYFSIFYIKHLDLNSNFTLQILSCYVHNEIIIINYLGRIYQARQMISTCQ